jgi:Domain of unknown function (DUF6265)
VEEVWLPPAGGMMLGMSRTVQDDTVRTFEQMVIRQGENGLLFEAAPSGQLPAAFLAGAVSDTEVVFENLTREFPRRIRYLRLGADSAFAQVSGEVRDRVRTIEYRYARVPCPGPQPNPE